MIAVAKDLPPIIRQMTRGDIAAVAAIESETYEYPWSIGIFRDCILAGYTSIVLDLDDETVGYAIMSVAAGEAHLLNICLVGRLRGKGIGRRLLGEMLRRSRAVNAERIFLEVRPSNKSALGLYHSMGFKALGVRQAYYKAREGNEDAVVLVRRFGDERDDPPDQ
jgi:ribosomal-protein-alanine N-acetyltransferase